MAEDQRVVWNNYLQQFGLQGLKTADGRDFLDAMVTDSWTAERIQAELTNTTMFQQAFPEYQAAIKAGNPMTPKDILNYRTTVTSLFKNAGLPGGFYDQADDFVNLISNNLSPAELQTRVNDGYARVANAPAEVKQAFSDYFGVNGDHYLAAFMLDPTKGTDLINRDIQTALIGGGAKQVGLNINQNDASQIAAGNISEYALRSGMTQAGQLRPLGEESISETTDLTDADILKGQLGVGSNEATTRRQQERSAAFKGGGGGAAESKTGLGLGAAR